MALGIHGLTMCVRYQTDVIERVRRWHWAYTDWRCVYDTRQM